MLRQVNINFLTQNVYANRNSKPAFGVNRQEAEEMIQEIANIYEYETDDAPHKIRKMLEIELNKDTKPDEIIKIMMQLGKFTTQADNFAKEGNSPDYEMPPELERALEALVSRSKGLSKGHSWRKLGDVVIENYPDHAQ